MKGRSQEKEAGGLESPALPPASSVLWERGVRFLTPEDILVRIACLTVQLPL